ncbi:alpha/beta hydrolase [Hymenobacter sp. BT635]|uniref:Alpha/beta hydrolase n=1 Tax=Hymenobacter nitidus TaxID=2880929 RepID=A0ABS8AKL7_9BACT|nr:alpha/beta fold hydrolase [Hymenobacter nitidus]MCB2380044.1 alpha/beta hydrolase [Hymenobacter nitidus]
MSETKHIYVVPRWGGTPRDDWYPWLKRELEEKHEAQSPRYEVHLLDMPAWELPDIDRAIDHLARVLPPAQLQPNIILVGHSVSCLAILHYLAKIGAEYPASPPQVGGVVCVAGWFSVDSPWQEVLNWIHAPIDFEAARRLIPAEKLVVLLSDDDPYTSGYQENEQLWVERLRSRVHILPGRQHFSSHLDADILEAIRDLADDLPQPALSQQRG